MTCSVCESNSIQVGGRSLALALHSSFLESWARQTLRRLCRKDECAENGSRLLSPKAQHMRPVLTCSLEERVRYSKQQSGFGRAGVN